jgi:prevent-host-death family protein
MKHVQASAAKTHLPELLDEVEQGATIVITRHGKAIARLVPDEDKQREDARRAIAEVREMRKNAPRVTVAEILAWRDEGRR